MAIDRSKNDVPLSFARGVDNRSQETKLAPGYARSAQDVEILRDGVVRRRMGTEKLATLQGAHSLWSSYPDIDFGLVGDATSLYAVDSTGALTLLRSSFNGSDFNYVRAANRTYYANGETTGVVNDDLSLADWGVETPIPQFVATITSGAGGLYAGRYEIALTYVNRAGEESGASVSVFADVAADGDGITLSNLPQPRSEDVVSLRIYHSGPNGETLKFYRSVPVGVSACSIGAELTTKLLDTQFLAQMPPLTCLLHKYGRIFGAARRQLVWSESLRYGLYRPAKNYRLVPSEIVMLASPDTPAFVIYIGTRNKVYALRGDSIDNASIAIANNSGVIPGSMKQVSAEALGIEGIMTEVPVWVSSDGIPFAGAEGGPIPLHKKFVYPIYGKAASAFIEVEGLYRLIIGGKGSRMSGLQVRDRAVASVYDSGGGSGSVAA